ncbi:MAG: T9SS type A sorting domain-containing protein, partial [Rhodothermaceae bacterium]|nr:T9SS type A sorting domain-containing protein [Rhodothermaceae bacterium]
KPDDFNVQFATVNGTGILRSTDGGRTWKNSFAGLVYGGARIEIAISQSHPEVIWASVQGTGTRSVSLPPFCDPCPVPDIYRSVDGGESWSFVENLDSVNDFSKAFLRVQGWYDNSIVVHPFSPDTVYIGGVNRWKTWIEGDGTTQIGTVGRFDNNASSFLDLVSFTGGTHANGRVALGPYDPDATDIALDEMTSVEIRFGPNLTQKAHRYSVPPNGGTGGDGGAGIALADYVYRDYVEVPFQVWDTDNNRQLMVSFRDQANDGAWDLIARNTSGPGNTHSREYIFISKHGYNANAPLSGYMTNGGFSSGLMYFMWPHLSAGDEVTWDPNSPTPGTLEIEFVTIKGETRNIAPWENSVVHVDHHNFTLVPIDESSNEFHILNGNDGGFAYSRDGGETWREGDAFPGFNTSQFYDATKRPGFPMYLGGMQDNGTWASYNNANSRRGWREMLPGDGFDVIWKGADSLMGSIQGNVIQRSIDGGTNWDLAGDILTWDGQFLTSIGWTPESGEAVFSISPDPAGGLLRSLDFGGTWQAIPARGAPVWASGNGGKVRVSLADPSVVWVGYRMRTASGAGRLHVTENALDRAQGEGVQNPVVLRPVSSPEFAPTSQISGLATHPFTRATAYVTFGVSCQPKLLRTEDMGQTWEDLSGFVGTDGCRSSNGFPNARVWDVEVFPQIPWYIWAGTDMGIFESRDHGETWAYADNGLPAVSVWRIRIVDGEVVVATHGRGVWSLDLTQVQTSVEEEAGTSVPTSFELLDNYPNPFNPSTTIGFKLAADSHIRVSVFDVLGRKVATLTDQPYSRGTHQITWDASAVSSGQYIYRMEADDKLIAAKSMVLVK